MNYGKRVSTRCRCPTGVPARDTHPQRMGPRSIKSDQETIPRTRSPPGHGTAPNSFAQGRGVAAAVHPISDAACFVESTTSVKRIVAKVRSGSARTNPREKFLDPIEQRVESPHVWVMIAPASSLIWHLGCAWPCDVLGLRCEPVTDSVKISVAALIARHDGGTRSSKYALKEDIFPIKVAGAERSPRFSFRNG